MYNQEEHISITIMSNQDKTKAQRLLALDILRGITIAGMILVNNPGSWGHIYAPLEHAEWNGLTPTDLVFPFFMFIMGISAYISLRKYNFECNKPTMLKILRRTVVIFLIGITIGWFGKFLRGVCSGKPLVDCVCTFDQLRILGVMPRLALCYGIGSLIAITVNHKRLPWIVLSLLVAYSAILLCGNGYLFSETNILYIIDHKVLGEAHLYSDTINDITLKFDPEGLTSTLPAIAHMLIGFICGSLIMKTRDNSIRINQLFIVGTILTFAGFLLSYGLPINKKIWSPTFVLTTCGLASSFLALLIWIIDIKGYRRWCKFFEVFGINPLFLYCSGAILSIVFGAVKVPYAAAENGVISIHGLIYDGLLMPLTANHATFASLCFAILFVMLNWLIGYVLYKKKIYIKI
jgi:predicted acyltransferase